MKKLFEYIKFSIFVTGVLMGVQIPGFIDQYGNNLDARVSESASSVAEFQGDADKYFNGDMDKLVKHYENKSDPVIVSGGESIGALVSRNNYLVGAQKKFNQSIYASYVHVFFNPVEQIRRDVWSNYTYKVVLNGSAIVIGILSGLVVCGAFELSIFLLFIIRYRRLTEKPKRTQKKHAPY